LLVIAAMASAKQAATHQSGPDATLRLSGGSFAAGIGFSSGSGTLTYKGKNYPVKVNGLSVGKVGMTSSSAYGEVFNLKHLQDFNGHYNVGAAGTRGVTLGAGKSGTIKSNQAGVIVRGSFTQTALSSMRLAAALTCNSNNIRSSHQARATADDDVAAHLC
jgi:hypothetical protein